MLFHNKYKPESIIEWDWKDSPNWSLVQTAIDHIRSFDLPFVFIDIDTKSDDCAVMIAPKGYTDELANLMYENRYTVWSDNE